MSLLDRVRAALAASYDVLKEQGRGGMATVFLARDRKHDRLVAIKVLHPDTAEAVGADRFLREVRITARLNHPHIVPLLDSGSADGLLYYVMPFVDGESLRQRLERVGSLPAVDGLRVIREVADAIGAAHASGIVHRDIKPENILLQGGHALVADFGIGRSTVTSGTAAGGESGLTATGVAIGTPAYMSPEQAMGAGGDDPRTDVYALGCVAYEVLTGEVPFAAPTAVASINRKLTEAPPELSPRPAGVSAAVAAAIRVAMAREAADRFGSVQAFVAALGDGHPSSVRVSSSSTRRVASTAGLAVLAAVVAFGGLWFGVRERRADVTPSRTDGPLASTMAVLPFENLSGDSTVAYIAEGLADELVTSLSQVPGMRVASRTSTGTLQRKGLELEEIAAKLDVETVLEGSLKVSGDRIRVSTRLVKVADGYPIWAQSYDRSSADVLRIQEEIAAAIAGALRGAATASASADALASGTTDPGTYKLYLQGAAMRSQQTEQRLVSAVRLFKDAIARDPRFARAWAGLASACAVQGWYDYRSPREAFPESMAAADSALRLDPRNASAQATKAYAALYYEWNLPKAEAAFRQAIAFDPNSAIAHQWYGNYLAVAQRWDESERAFATALRLDPAPSVRHAVAIWVQHFRGDDARSIATFYDVAQFDSTYAPIFQWGAKPLLATGRVNEAVAALERAVTLSNRGAAFVADLAAAKAIQGDRAAAKRLLDEVLGKRVVPAYEVAKVYLALGDKAQALRWLARAYDARTHSMVFLRIDRQLDPLRGDPAFEALAKQVGV
ncbi:MAG: protein kinase [Gemmatimonadaceae bacterium]|nr:protein kinase [Gemmatimonadaceae bacterium]